MSDYQGPAGKTTIAPEVIRTIARLTASHVPGVCRMSIATSNVDRFFNRKIGEGVCIDIKDDMVSADLYVVLMNGVNMREVGRMIQQEVARAITEMVGLQVRRVNVHIEDVDFEEAEA